MAAEVLAPLPLRVEEEFGERTPTPQPLFLRMNELFNLYAEFVEQHPEDKYRSVLVLKDGWSGKGKGRIIKSFYEQRPDGEIRFNYSSEGTLSDFVVNRDSALGMDDDRQEQIADHIEKYFYPPALSAPRIKPSLEEVA